MDKQLKDKIFDEMLKSALEKDLEQEAQNLPAEEELEPVQFSPEFEQKMKRLFQQQKKDKKQQGFRASKVAIAVAGILVFTTIAAMQVDAFRIPAKNLVIQVTEKYTAFDFKEQTSGTTTIPDDFKALFPTYSPGGFTMTEMEEGKIHLYVHYEKENEFYLLTIYKKLQDVSLDTEEAKVTEMMIHDNKAWLIEKKGKIHIFMVKGTVQYFLLGNIDKDMGIKIMESIK